MSVTSPVSIPDLDLPPLPLRRIAVEEYLRMVTAEVFDGDDRLELLEGWLLPKRTRNPPHEVGVTLAQDTIRPLVPAGWHLRNQA
jgi:hypothetical protein